MGCIYNGVCSSLAALFLWQQVTNLAAVMAHGGICGHCAHSLSSLESHVCLRRPFSIARLCSLSLYTVKAFLKFGSVTVVRYSATVYLLSV